MKGANVTMRGSGQSRNTIDTNDDGKMKQQYQSRPVDRLLSCLPLVRIHRLQPFLAESPRERQLHRCRDVLDNRPGIGFTTPANNVERKQLRYETQDAHEQAVEPFRPEDGAMSKLVGSEAREKRVDRAVGEISKSAGKGFLLYI